MINHVMVGTSDIDRAKAFYDAVLGVLGAGAPFEHTTDGGTRRIFYNVDGHTFGVTQPIDGNAPTVANGSTIGFKCKDMDQVRELHDVAVANGGTSIEDPPGPRESNMGVMNLSYFTDPDGHKLCGINRQK